MQATNGIKTEGMQATNGIKTEDVQATNGIKTENMQATNDKTAKDMNAVLAQARAAREKTEYVTAAELYKQYADYDPDCFEAQAYAPVYAVAAGPAEFLGTNLTALKNSFAKALHLLKDTKSDEEIKKLLREYAVEICWIADHAALTIKTNYAGKRGNEKNSANQRIVQVYIKAVDACYSFGNLVIALFGEEYAKTIVLVWKIGMQIHVAGMEHLNFKSRLQHNKLKDEYIKKILTVDPSFAEPKARETEYAYKM